ncbi:hypothetical protein M0R89_09595 [Halorussus limi]|uniref:Uncharacterized protein n=1 Tax=Halorussus limi TaxID=2938695 RepID=A0A8U0HPY3_9EURY|nr:hypothetical protein [Halorussus limi]UPV72803.1 hypothetical protein M0R89_09595 [Halorussus limi]
MKRVWFAVVGVFFALFGVGFLAAFGVESLADPTALATLALWFGASALYVLGGLDAPVGDLRWYQSVGLGNVCLGLQMVVRVPSELAGVSGDFEPLLAALAGGVGGLTLAYIGLDWFRGGRHFDLSAFEESPTNA